MRFLWNLLDELEKTKSVKKIDVVRAAGLGTELESTKRLYTCTIPPELSADKRLVREKALVQKVEKYLLLARSAATLAKVDPDLLLEPLFKGTSYGSDQILGDEISPPWAHALVEIFNRMADWVSVLTGRSNHTQ